MDNFYEIFNINYFAPIQEINIAYKKHMLKYKNKEIKEEDIFEIKKLKTGYYILSNETLRKKYNKLLIKNKNIVDKKNDTFVDNDLNSNLESNLQSSLQSSDLMDFDTAFSKDNTNYIEMTKNDNKKSKKNNNNFISDRIFSLNQLHNLPTIPTQIMKPVQCRINNE